ncbi:hypothetical protein K9L27_02075 [Candidatus Gracilibacteria bacterium]|nr:hypothetical protein [Candidatus Gracilibacteria bacterium]
MSFWKKIFGFKESSCCGCCCSSPENKNNPLNFTKEDLLILKNIDKRIVIGKVLEVVSHPDPEITKVRVTKTDIGNGKIEQILCGGTNVCAGIIVAVATVGAKLSEDFEIGIRSIRGIESRGMICARSELNLSPAGEQKGEIWILPENLEAKLGTPLRNIL